MSQDDVANSIPLNELKSNQAGQREVFIDADANMEGDNGPASPGIGARFDF